MKFDTLLSRCALLLTTVCAAGLFVGSSAQAFGRKGHAMVAHLAELHLTEAAKTGVRQDLCGEWLSDVANWGDDIHNNPQYKGILPLHYVNISEGKSTYEESAKDPAGDLVVATQILDKYLESGDEKELKKLVALRNIGRQAALKLLTHFYGDLHQPLHVSRADDVGGNTIKVNFFGENTNLHSVWDEGMLKMRPEWDALHYAEYLDRHFKNEPAASWQTKDAVAWADYSFSLHQQVQQYPDPQPTDPKALPVISYNYMDQFMPLLEKQIWLGGMRLAYAINKIYAQ